MPVDALKNTMGDPVGAGDWLATRLATRAIFILFSLRTIPRLMRWLKNSLFMMSLNLISKIRRRRSLSGLLVDKPPFPHQGRAVFNADFVMGNSHPTSHYFSHTPA